MSRIGKKILELPPGCELKFEGRKVSVKGPKGELALDLVNEVALEQNENKWSVLPKDLDSKRAMAMWGLHRTLIQNMIDGVSKGFEKELELVGVGYRAQMKGKDLQMQLGLSHDVIYSPPDGVKVEVGKPTEIKISGIDKQQVGQAAANIRRWRPPEPYKGKGIHYKGKHVRRKESKKK